MKPRANRAKRDGGPWPFFDEEAALASPAARAASGRDAPARAWSGGSGNGWKSGWPMSVRALPTAMGLVGPPDGQRIVTLGWHPDVPDARDRSIGEKELEQRVARSLERLQRTGRLPARFENLRWCSPVEDQGALGSCTAHAVVGLMEFMQRRTGIEHVDGSRLFLYKVTRKLLGLTGDSGAYIRTAMKAVAAFGIPPEEYWPYDVARYEDEPSAFLYSFGQRYRALDYARVDMAGRGSDWVLDQIKRLIAGGLGVAFGFSVYSSLTASPDIPVPAQRDRLRGGHAVLAVGYDDGHELGAGATCPSLVIRNSWGPGWGVGGYGFLPYDYVRLGLARDFWTVLKADWMPMEQFDE